MLENFLLREYGAEQPLPSNTSLSSSISTGTSYQSPQRTSRGRSVTAYNNRTCPCERVSLLERTRKILPLSQNNEMSSRKALPSRSPIFPARIRRRSFATLAWLSTVLSLATFAGSMRAADQIAQEQDTEVAGDWPLARGDAQSSGAISVTLPSDLSVLWEFKANEAIETTPVVSNGRVFAADVMGKVYAINFDNGKEIWSHNYDTGFLASPSVGELPKSDISSKNESVVVFGDVEGNLYALDPATGVERWKQSTEGEINGSAAFFEDKVLVTSQDGKLYAFAIADGKPVWSYQTDDQIRCNPTIAGSQTFLGGCDGSLHRVDLNTGKVIGEPMPLGGPTGSTAAVVGDKAFIPIMDGAVLALDWNAGTELWRYEDPDRPQEYRGSAAVTDSLVIVTSRNKFVDAISIETGEQVWRHTLRRRSDASPVVAGKDVWIASTDGRLVRLSKETGEETWQYEISGAFVASPAIAHNRLIIADDNGVIRVFGQKATIDQKSDGSAESRRLASPSLPRSRPFLCILRLVTSLSSS